MPDWMWALQRKHVVHPLFVWFTVGLYHPAVRELMGYTWSDRDERRHRLLGKVIGKVFTLVPSRHRMHPRARGGGSRHRPASGRRAAGAHACAQSAAGRAPRQRHALLPEGLTHLAAVWPVHVEGTAESGEMVFVVGARP
jgi:hypothetical protein